MGPVERVAMRGQFMLFLFTLGLTVAGLGLALLLLGWLATIPAMAVTGAVSSMAGGLSCYAVIVRCSKRPQLVPEQVTRRRRGVPVE